MNIAQSGGMTFVPATSIDADMSQMTLSADFVTQTVSAEITLCSIDAAVEQPTYNADIIKYKIEGTI